MQSAGIWQEIPKEAGTAESAAAPAMAAAATPAATTTTLSNQGNTDLEAQLEASLIHANQLRPMHARMMAALCVAIDALTEAQQYATRKGLGIAFSGEDVRTVANTMLINCERGAR